MALAPFAVQKRRAMAVRWPPPPTAP